MIDVLNKLLQGTMQISKRQINYPDSFFTFCLKPTKKDQKLTFSVFFIHLKGEKLKMLKFVNF